MRRCLSPSECSVCSVKATTDLVHRVASRTATQFHWPQSQPLYLRRKFTMNGQQGVLTIITICYVVLSSIVVLVALLTMYRLLRRSARSWTGSREIFGGELKTRLIGLGISSLFFPTVLPDFLSAIFKVVTGFFREIEVLPIV